MFSRKRLITLTPELFNKKLKYVKEFYNVIYDEEVKTPLGLNAYINDKKAKIELTFKDPAIPGTKATTYICDKSCSALQHERNGLDAWTTLQKYYKIPHIGDKYDALSTIGSVSGILYYNEEFNGTRQHAYGYDMNSAFAWGMLQNMPANTEAGPINLDKYKQPVPRRVQEDEIGFTLTGDLVMPRGFAAYIFKSMPSPFQRFVSVWYGRKKDAKNAQEKTVAKDILVMSVGFMQRHNFWMRAAIIGHCNRRIKQLIKQYPENILLSNTDSIVSNIPIPELEDQIGLGVGQWKLEHEGEFAYDGFNYQWDENCPTYRGVCKSWFKDDFDILKDSTPGANNYYMFDKEKLKLKKVR